MTETTDISALREAAMKATAGEWCTDSQHSVIADAGMNANYYVAACSGPDSQINASFISLANPATIIALLDQLKAERQRGDSETKSAGYWRRAAAQETDRANKAEEELAALRGEQDHGDTTVYMMPNVFASLVNTARDVALEYKNAQCLRDALSRELKGYFTLTSQPKTVVVLTPPINPLMFNSDVMFGYNKARAEDRLAIEFAGIVVKDGE